jgi:small subunit ribosomal protein S20
MQRQRAKVVRRQQARRLRNRFFRTTTRTLVGKARSAIAGGEREAAAGAVTQAIKQLDKAAGKGVLHRNNAARRKSRLMAAFAKAFGA